MTSIFPVADDIRKFVLVKICYVQLSYNTSIILMFIESKFGGGLAGNLKNTC